VTHLLDGNVLVALVVEDHIHHEAARTWFAGAEGFATCPITQGTLLRLLLRNDMPTADALGVLTRVTGHARHEFWPDDLGYAEVAMRGVVGHRQVTDAYLAELARSRKGCVATFDQGFIALHPDVAHPLEP
jgi:toxin-antitoxin system PIN domain toxin